MKEPRYFVHERIDCIAVCDRESSKPGFPVDGVVAYWEGRPEPINETCQACGRKKDGSRVVISAWQKTQAILKCAELNASHSIATESTP